MAKDASREKIIRALNQDLALEIAASSNSNNFTGNSMYNCTTNGDYACIFFPTISNSNIFIDNKINLSAYSGITVKGNHNLFKNTNITNVRNYVVNVTSGTNNTFINMTYDNETVFSGAQLIRKWYYSANVTNTSGQAINGANVSIYNGSNQIETNLTTGVDGLTSQIELIEYISNGTKTY